MLTLQRLNEALAFDTHTGQVLWRIRAGRRKPGDPAGRVIKDGRIQIMLDGVLYPRTHLMWFHVHGEWPPTERLDHKDRDPTCDAIENLRPATAQQNTANRSLAKNSQTGVKGVTLDKTTGLFRARIMKDGKRLCLGSFSSKALAGDAYATAAAELFGDFACA